MTKSNGICHLLIVFVSNFTESMCYFFYVTRLHLNNCVKYIDADNLMRSVVIGNSIGVLRYSGNRTGNIYVRHSSEVTIEVKGDSKVFIEAYDRCIVRVVCDKDSKAFVYWHGGMIYYGDNVIIRDRRNAGK